jgi:hypothetical protein
MKRVPAGFRHISASANEQGSLRHETVPIDLTQTPRLAPPVDIVSGCGNSFRRRPNPNNVRPNNASILKFNHSSHQGPSNSSIATTFNSATAIIPGTPPQSRPSGQTSTPAAAIALPEQRTPAQNALMEQDAIETLLFMSSPENSGYHPSSQQSHHRKRSGTSRTPSNISQSPSKGPTTEARLGLGLDGVLGQGDQRQGSGNPGRKVSFLDDSGADSSGPAYVKEQNAGFEHEAGDEIDRLLDEMADSDSDMESGWYAHTMVTQGLRREEPLQLNGLG